eukprot:GEMP01078601.1.p1 GENE.GEMP01078601.1~~GEMP01078601.1.p1  ORF type:complete len:135 (+),score=28.34 GEMP01078601.1:541-945(+)
MINADVMKNTAGVPFSGIILVLAACVCSLVLGMHSKEFHVLNSMASDLWSSICRDHTMGVFLFCGATIMGIRVASNLSAVDSGLCADKEEMESKMRVAQLLSRTKKTMKMEAQQLNHVVISLQQESLASQSNMR